MIDDKTLEALDQAERAATPGPWEICPGDSAIITAYIPKGYSFKHQLYEADMGKRLSETSHFIALSRNHMRELIDEVQVSRQKDNDARQAAATEQIVNAMLRAELVAARDAFKYWHEGDEGYVHSLKCIKRIDDTLGMGDLRDL